MSWCCHIVPVLVVSSPFLMRNIGSKLAHETGCCLQYAAILVVVMTVLQAVAGDAIWYSSGTVCDYHRRCDVVTHSCIAFRAYHPLLLHL